MKALKISLLLLFVSVTVFSICRKSLWNHIYNKERLVIIKPCVTIKGTIYNLVSEKDGDYHIRVKVDKQYAYMLNDKNKTNQHGCLVAEIIYGHRCTQPDAIAAGTGYANNINIPHNGERVTITGSYVNDKDHGWNEIHPVSSMTEIP